jgi:hypothetical protein
MSDSQWESLMAEVVRFATKACGDVDFLHHFADRASPPS